MEPITSLKQPVVIQLPKNKSILSKLPIDLILSILSQLPTLEQVRFQRICREFYHLAKHPATNLSKLTSLRMMTSEKLNFTVQTPSFACLKNNLLCNEGPNWYWLDLNNQTRKVIFSTQYKKILWGELSNCIYFIYNDEKQMKILFASSSNTEEVPFAINISALINDKKFIHRKTGIFVEKQPYSFLQVSDYLLCFTDNKCAACIKSDKVISVSFSNDYLITTSSKKQEKKKVYSQQLYNLSTQQLLAKREFTEEMGSMLYESLISSQYLVNVLGIDEQEAKIELEILDLDFKLINHFSCNCRPDFNDVDRIHFGDNIVFYCYENRFVAFINNRELIFFDLPSGKKIKEYNLGELEDEELEISDLDRVYFCDDKIIAGKDCSIGLYDIRTCKLIAEFETSEPPIWVEMHYNPLFGYKINYTVRDSKTEELRYERVFSQPCGEQLPG